MTMRIFARGCVTLVVMLSCCRSRGAEPIVADKVKAVMVLVTYEEHTREVRCAGVLAKRAGNTAYVAIAAQKEAAPQYKIFFYSGTKSELKFDASLILTDSESGISILKSDAVAAEQLPAPLPGGAAVAELQALIQFGFSANDQQINAGPHPAVSSSNVAVSSVRKNTHGIVQAIQLDGVSNAGQLGGALVDAKGSLIGITLSRLPYSYIGLALPAAKVDEIFNGKPGKPEFQEISRSTRGFKFRVKVPLLDPLNNVEKVAIDFFQTLSPTDKPSKTVDLVVENSAATGEIELPGSPYAYRFEIRTQAAAEAKGTRAELRPVYNVTAVNPQTDESDWLASDTHQSEVRRAEKENVSVEVSRLLRETTIDVVDAKVTSLRLDSKVILPCMLFSEDGKFVYLLELSGTVRKISVPEFVEKQQFSIGRNCSWMAPSKEGVLVSVADLEQVWLLDWETLNLKFKVNVPGVRRVAGNRRQSIAFAGNGYQIVSIDLIKGTIDKTINVSDVTRLKPGDRPACSDYRTMNLTPDGLNLLIADTCIHRFRVNGAALKYEQSGSTATHIVDTPIVLSISPDSESVVLLAARNSYPNNRPAMYSVKDLTKAQKQIPESYSYPIVEWDKDGSIYMRSDSFHLGLFDKNLAPGKKYNFPFLGNPSQALIHPDGKRLFILGSKLYWVEMPR